jgi:hypothetical protein
MREKHVILKDTSPTVDEVVQIMMANDALECELLAVSDSMTIKFKLQILEVKEDVEQRYSSRSFN